MTAPKKSSDPDQKRQAPFAARRLFAGLAIDETKSQPLQHAVAKLKRTADEHEFRVRWVERQLWHVTLWFFGNVEQDRQREITAKVAAIAAAHEAAVELDVRGIGAFPEPTSARVLWAGVNRTRELLELQSRARDADLAYDDHHLYNPHLTIGRFRNPQSATPLIEPFARKPFFSYMVKEIVLFESTMQNFYPVYSPIERFALGR